jgi:DNA-binding PadR family transcriptional regulator
MTAVFSHGRLRLYLLKLLAEGPKHGYELIRLLENRFLGLYAPSAGTIYPRLQRMEAEGLVTHTAAGGRKVYEITDDGRAELTHRAGELADLESEIHASVADLTTLASEIEQQVSGSVRDIKRELRDAAREARTPGRPPWQSARTNWTSHAQPESPAADDLERVVAELAAEVRHLAQRSGLGESELRAAAAVLTSALSELRRLLRR